MGVSAALFICNAQRSILASVATQVGADLGLSLTSLGLLSSAYLWGYAPLQIPAGRIADELGGVTTIFACLLLWCVGRSLTSSSPPTRRGECVGAAFTLPAVAAFTQPAVAGTHAGRLPRSSRR